MQSYADKWAHLDGDSESDEEELQSVRRTAAELRDRANAVSYSANDRQGGAEGDHAKAISLYEQADRLLSGLGRHKPLSDPDKQMLIQCRLNVATLALHIGDDRRVLQSCSDVLKLDAKHPHAALLRLQSAIARRDQKEAATWSCRAQSWARARGESQVLQRVADMALPSAVRTAKEYSWLQELLQESVSNIKQRQIEAAKVSLEQVIGFLDGMHGGPAENIIDTRLSTWAFDALEASAEVAGLQGRWRDALSLGRRAASLLEGSSMAKSMLVPDLLRRRGLLHLSLGHSTAASGGDPMPDLRRAAEAFREHTSDPANEGRALLEIGQLGARCAMPESASEGGLDIIEELVAVFATAQERIIRARESMAASVQPGESTPVLRMQSRLALSELTIQAMLATLLLRAGDLERAGAALDLKGGLLESAPQDPDDPASAAAAPPELLSEWAESCSDWAVAATKLLRFEEAEGALLVQLRLGKALGSGDMQLEALQAVAVLRRKQNDDAGVEKFLGMIEVSAAAFGRLGVVEHVRRALATVAPRTGPEPPLAAADVGLGQGPGVQPGNRSSSQETADPAKVCYPDGKLCAFLVGSVIVAALGVFLQNYFASGII